MYDVPLNIVLFQRHIFLIFQNTLKKKKGSNVRGPKAEFCGFGLTYTALDVKISKYIPIKILSNLNIYI